MVINEWLNMLIAPTKHQMGNNKLWKEHISMATTTQWKRFLNNKELAEKLCHRTFHHPFVRMIDESWIHLLLPNIGKHFSLKIIDLHMWTEVRRLLLFATERYWNQQQQMYIESYIITNIFRYQNDLSAIRTQIILKELIYTGQNAMETIVLDSIWF